MSIRTRSVAVAVSAITGIVGKMSSQFLELAIFRPKIVAPLADAMRLVDCDLRNVPVQRALKKVSSMSRSGAT